MVEWWRLVGAKIFKHFIKVKFTVNFYILEKLCQKFEIGLEQAYLVQVGAVAFKFH